MLHTAENVEPKAGVILSEIGISDLQKEFSLVSFFLSLGPNYKKINNEVTSWSKIQ